MSSALFHPQMKGLEAQRIVRAHGGRLVWRSDRQRLVLAIKSADQAAASVADGNYTAALQHLRAARQQIEEVRHA